MLAIGTAGGQVLVYGVGTGTPTKIATLDETSAVNSVAFSSDGMLAIGTARGQVLVYDLAGRTFNKPDSGGDGARSTASRTTAAGTSWPSGPLADTCCSTTWRAAGRPR